MKQIEPLGIGTSEINDFQRPRRPGIDDILRFYVAVDYSGRVNVIESRRETVNDAPDVRIVESRAGVDDFGKGLSGTVFRYKRRAVIR